MLLMLKKKNNEKYELLNYLEKNNINYEKAILKGTELIKIESNDLTLAEKIKTFEVVNEIINNSSPFPLISSKNFSPDINIRGTKINSSTFSIIAGPCTIESKEDLFSIGYYLKKKGIKFIRGGAFKMRTSPYHFAGLGFEGINFLEELREKTELITVSEITCVEHIPYVAERIDILQVGTRNMHNYAMLEKLGKLKNPILLKRGMSSTIEEWLLAAERIVLSGNPNVILCERGIRTFENYTRNTLDIAVVPAVKELCNLPIIIDPSHSSGKRSIVKSVSLAGMAAGADGLIIETHFKPESTVCDSKQTINYNILNEIIESADTILPLWDKRLN